MESTAQATKLTAQVVEWIGDFHTCSILIAVLLLADSALCATRKVGILQITSSDIAAMPIGLLAACALGVLVFFSWFAPVAVGLFEQIFFPAEKIDRIPARADYQRREQEEHRIRPDQLRAYAVHEKNGVALDFARETEKRLRDSIRDRHIGAAFILSFGINLSASPQSLSRYILWNEHWGWSAAAIVLMVIVVGVHAAQIFATFDREDHEGRTIYLYRQQVVPQRPALRVRDARTTPPAAPQPIDDHCLDGARPRGPGGGTGDA